MNKKYYVIDIETLAGIFTHTSKDVITGEVFQYVIHMDRNDLKEYINHLKQTIGHITFNGNNFDYPVIHFILTNYHEWDNLSNEEIITLIYEKAQQIIELSNSGGFPAIREKDCLIKQLDLFRVWHYNNKARFTSLKALEISMNYPNVMDMPIEHTEKNISFDEIEEILEYNLNDVDATYEFYKKTVELGKIELRKKIQQKYNLPCINWNNGKIGENLILKLYCDKTGLNQWDIKNTRSHYEKIELKDCIPNNIKFESTIFNNLLDFYKRIVIHDTTNIKGIVDYTLIYKNLKYQYGTGGLHAAIASGIYESDNNYIIKSADVASLYPNLPIANNFYIQHLGPEFLEVYKNNIVDVRLNEKQKPKKEQDSTIIDGYKEAANVPYGKSNDLHSFLYDPMYTLKTTISGQLAISMLAERLSDIPDSQILMINTDGLEIKIPREYEKLYSKICSEWEKETKLILEFVDYQKMWIADINTYGCISVDGKIKNKGRLEVDKMIGNEPAYHKDNSFRIIPLALQEYFINNTPVEITIKNHFNNTYNKTNNYGIYDFCGRQKFKGKDYGEIHYFENTNNGPELRIEKQQKNTRYFISTNGATFIKQYAKGSQEFIHVGNKVTIFNKYIEKKDYFIDYQWYIRECNKEIRNIINEQLTLF